MIQRLPIICFLLVAFRTSLNLANDDIIELMLESLLAQTQDIEYSISKLDYAGPLNLFKESMAQLADLYETQLKAIDQIIDFQSGDKSQALTEKLTPERIAMLTRSLQAATLHFEKGAMQLMEKGSKFEKCLKNPECDIHHQMSKKLYEDVEDELLGILKAYQDSKFA